MSIYDIVRYVSLNDTEEPKTVFLLSVKGLNLVGLDIISKTRSNQKPPDSEVILNTFSVGVVGIEYLYDRTGRPIKFSTKKMRIWGKDVEVVHDDIMRGIPPKIIDEVVWKLSEMAKDAAEKIKRGNYV